MSPHISSRVLISPNAACCICVGHIEMVAVAVYELQYQTPLVIMPPNIQHVIIANIVQILHAAIADVFSSAVLVTMHQYVSQVEMIGSQSGTSFWMSCAISSHYLISVDHVDKDTASVCLISPTLILDAERELFPFTIWRRTRSSFHAVTFKRYQHNSWYHTQHRTFQMGPCDTPVILDISVWENPRWPEKWMIIIKNCRFSVDLHNFHFDLRL